MERALTPVVMKLLELTPETPTNNSTLLDSLEMSQGRTFPSSPVQRTRSSRQQTEMTNTDTSMCLPGNVLRGLCKRCNALQGKKRTKLVIYAISNKARVLCERFDEVTGGSIF